MEDLIVRQLKQQKIFAFNSYQEFFHDYFKRDLVAVEELNRIHNLVAARKKYSMRGRMSTQRQLMLEPEQQQLK